MVALQALLGLATLTQLGQASLQGAEASKSFQDRCLAFKPEHHVKNSTRTRLEFISGGTTLKLDDNVASCERKSQAVHGDLCRVALQIPTSKRSSISFELWLPESWDEHKRFVATGNGGVDGCIKYEDLAYGAANGFAAVGTNNGHNGTTAVTMLNNPDVIEDFAHRALHTGTEYGKKLVKEFYKKHHEHSYYIGCSLGGRMGIGAADRYPEDYDGIVAGAPAVDFLHMNGYRANFFTITGDKDSKDYIPLSTWTGLIHDEVLNQCDELDGIKDGIIEIANECYFDPTKLRCRDDQTAPKECLNDAQIQQVKEIYASYEYPDGTLIFPRMNPGNEVYAVKKLIAGEPFAYSVDWFRYVVYNDTEWDPVGYNTDDVAVADAQNPFNIRTWPKDLSEYKKRGGKVLSYHGGQDQQITAFNTERFWNHLHSSDNHLDEYFRFFRISGMTHCNGGPGAWVLGQGGNAPAAGIPFDAKQNVLAALVDWVEKKEAPTTITGTKFVDDNVKKGIDFERAHCMYPLKQTYIGGDHKLASSWVCKEDGDEAKA
ncbi:tannase and feruloyl esterase [Sarocladium strictum]